MSARIRRHIRSNVVGYVALFVALSGTAYAVDGPLAGQNQVGSEDIINGEVKRDDIAGDAVRTGKVLDETLLGADIAPGAISTSEVVNGTLSASDLASNSVGYAEIAPDAFNTEINDSGFFYGIADNSIQSNEVTDNSLTNLDIRESTLAPTIDAVHSAGSDDAFGPTITSRDIDNPTNVRTDNLNAGTWIVFAEVRIFNNDDDATGVSCGIWTDDTRRELTGENIEAVLDDSGWEVNLPMTASFTTSSPTTLRLACINGEVGGDDGELRPLSADLVAIPVASLG
ncbi:MAG TPA: hypothetical protein VNO51_00085 [Ilumatobacteraceae bacterium]|nr:hypothetical protein [Ilumatobacteraceae bacterium]